MTEVVAALIWQGDKFMICQRPAHKACGLLWEFVGGKVEPGETKEQALIRECQEELAVTLSVGDMFMDVIHEYPDLTVHLTLFNATIAEGEPVMLEHNDIKWIAPSEIGNYEFCPADVEILKKISTDYYYKKHWDFAGSIIKVNDIPNDNIEEHCHELLAALPNSGKLYKYRSLIGGSFENTYDSLVNGYLWIPPADSLNDDFDSILFGDALSYHRRMVDYLCHDNDKFIFFSLKKKGKTLWEKRSIFGAIAFEALLSCFDEQNFNLIDERLLSLLTTYFDDQVARKQALNEIKLLIKESIGLPCAESFVMETYRYNRDLCSRLHVFSMSDSYDLDNMWGYYADSGKGFCIEYDFSKMLALDDDSKKILLNTYKVQYSKSPKLFDIEAYAEVAFFENLSVYMYKRLISSILSQTVTKDETWDRENEWRVVIGDIEPKVFIDIVSGIIIDRRSLDEPNAKKLINLCVEKGWNIKVRCRSFFDGKHYFADYYEYIKAANEKQ